MHGRRMKVEQGENGYYLTVNGWNSKSKTHNEVLRWGPRRLENNTVQQCLVPLVVDMDGFKVNETVRSKE